MEFMVRRWFKKNSNNNGQHKQSNTQKVQARWRALLCIILRTQERSVSFVMQCLQFEKEQKEQKEEQQQCITFVEPLALKDCY